MRRDIIFKEETIIRVYLIEGGDFLTAAYDAGVVYFDLTDIASLLKVNLTISELLRELPPGAVHHVYGRAHLNLNYIDRLIYLSSDSSSEPEQDADYYIQYVKNDFKEV